MTVRGSAKSTATIATIEGDVFEHADRDGTANSPIPINGTAKRYVAGRIQSRPGLIIFVPHGIGMRDDPDQTAVSHFHLEVGQ